MFNSLRKQPRLVQWNGRRQSSTPPKTWARLLVPPILVLATIVAVTLLAVWWGPPMPHRLGEVLHHDLRVRVDFEVVNHVEFVNQQERAADPTGAPVREQAQYNERPVVEKYPRGMLLVPRDTPIAERQLGLLKREHHAFVHNMRNESKWIHATAQFLIFGLLAGFVVLYVRRFQTALTDSLPTIAGICGLALATLLIGVFVSQPPWHLEFLPLTITALMLALAYNSQFALVLSLCLAVSLSVILGTGVERFLQALAGLSTAVLLLRSIRTRTQLVEVAAIAGAAFLAMTVATGMLTDQTFRLILADGVRHFLCGALAGFLLTGFLPLVERSFGVVTDISLLELADGSHPLLKELVRRAPGTYTHSITVATLAEAAAEAIGANHLLVRVGSYFHDVGKMLKPHYFIENQTGDNRHDQLEPALSTLVIIGHVKDGIALAHQYRLPQPIIDFIAQHHGTTLVEYFYREAMRMQEGNGMAADELEANFRYPGPRPQSRENGVVMLADAIESISRAHDNPTPGSLQKLVNDLVMKRLLDGQFEESGLTLTELNLIQDSLAKSLIALFHARIKYPEEVPCEKAG